MPYSRPIGRFYLTPPSVFIFVISLVLALFAIIAAYGHIGLIKASYAFILLVIAYIVLMIGCLFRGV